jgi:hypothetical protein
VLGALPPAARKTVTFDRGTEFAAWRTLRAAKGYFCDPHSPWQKGGVENASGRIRRHLPLASAAEVFAAHLTVNPSEASSPNSPLINYRSRCGYATYGALVLSPALYIVPATL